MSSYSFSHQFYQRWTCAPEAIRAAITQELKDITSLLQSETPFESFVFHTHDLDAHVDELYENHEAEQAIAKAIADKQAQEQAAAEKQHLEQERLEQEKSKAAKEEAKRKEEAKLKQETMRREQAEAAQKQPKKTAESVIADHADTGASTDTNTIEGDTTSNVVNNAKSDTASDIATENKTISEYANALDDDSSKADKQAKNENSIKAVNDKASTAISLSLKDAKLNGTHQALIRELEMQIDDYLSDQMMLMSENLKSWLHAEMVQHLTEQDSANSNNVTDDGLKQK